MGRNTEGKAEDSKDRLEPMRKNHNPILIACGRNDPSTVEKLVPFTMLQKICLAQDLESLKKEIWQKLEGLWLRNQDQPADNICELHGVPYTDQC